MKRTAQISVVVITLSVILLMSIAAGEGILKILAGPSPLSDNMSFEQAEGSYLSCQVTYPVASYPDEYYTGDPGRVKRKAYIVYDEGRQAFFKIIVSKEASNDLDRLLRAANMSEQTKEAWGDDLESQLKPVTVSGSFTLIESSDAITALSESLTNTNFKGTEAQRAEALAQSSWYVLDCGFIRGVSTWEYRLCMVVIGINLLFLLIALICLLPKRAGKDFLSKNPGSPVTLFLKKQLPWLSDWCKKGGLHQFRTAFLIMFLMAAGLTAIGFYLKYTVFYIIIVHLSLGLLIGQIFGLPFLLGIGVTFNPDRLLKCYSKAFEKLYPVQTEREAIAQNLLEADDSWVVREQGKETCACATLGERYWIIFHESGQIVLADSSRAERMYSKTEIMHFRTGKVRHTYTSHTVYVYYQEEEEQTSARNAFVFKSEGAAGQFMNLARKRLGDRAQTVIQELPESKISYS